MARFGDPPASRSARFWVPGSRRRLIGTYDVSTDGGVDITLWGGLVDHRTVDPAPIPVLFADVDGTPATCADVSVMESTAIGTPNQRDRFWVTTSFEGARWHSPDTKRHNLVGISLSELDGWVHQQGIEHLPEGFGWRQAYPAAQTARTPVGEVSLETSASAQWRAGEATMRTVQSVSCRPDAPMTLADAWQSFVMPMRALLSIASLGPVNVGKLQLASKGLPQPPVLVRSHRERSDSEPKRFSDFLFTTRTWDVGEHLPTWFDLWRRANVALTTFTAAYSSDTFTVSTFLSVASATEALHAALHPELDEPSSRQAAKLERVLANIEKSRDRTWARSFLKNAHRPSLHNRLLLLANDLGEDVMYPLVRNPEAWAAQVAEVRNAITHSDQRSWDYQADAELLVNLTETLRIVFVLTVLMEIGFDQRAVSDVARENRHLRHWLGRYNPGA